MDKYSTKDSLENNNISNDAKGIMITSHDNNSNPHKSVKIRRTRTFLETTNYISSYQIEKPNNKKWIRNGSIITSIAVNLVTLFTRVYQLFTWLA